MTTQVSTIRTNFQAGGISDVQNAFKSIVISVKDAEAAAIAAARVTEKAFKDSAGALGRYDRERAAEAKKLAKERENEARKTAKAEEKAWAETNKELAKLEKERISDQKARLKESTRAFVEAEKEKTKAARSEHEQRLRDEENFLKANAQKTIGARVSDFRKTAGGYAGNMAGQGVGMAANAAGMAMGVFGGFQAADAMKKLVGFESAAVNLSNATYIPDMVGPGGKTIKGVGRAKTSDIMDIAKEGQAATGFDKEELLTAWQSYIEKSSDSAAFVGDDPKKRAAAKKTLFDLAKLAKGSGTNIMEMMGAAGALKTQNENMSSEDMMKTMLNIVGQGKLGAVSMADLASHASVITASAGSFGMGQTQAQRALLGLSQISVQSAGSPAEAATATARFVSDTMDKQKKLRAIGVEVNDKDKDGRTKGLRDPAEIISDVFRKTGGDMAKIGAIYGERGIKPFSALQSVYNSAETEALAKNPKAKRGEAGAAAVLEKVQKFERQGYDPKDAAADFAAVQATKAERFKQAEQRVQEQFQTSLTPALEQFAAVLPQLTQHVAGAVAYFAGHPFQGIGAMIGASIAKDLAAAGIQKLVTNAFTSSAGAMQLGTIAVTAGVAYLAYNKLAEEADKNAKDVSDRGQLGAEAVGVEAELKAAKTPEEVQKALSKARAMKANLEKGREDATKEDTTDKALGALTHLPGVGSAAKESLEAKNRVSNDQYINLTKSLADLEKAMAEAAKKMNATASAMPNSGGSTSPDHPDRNAPMSAGARGGTMH